MSPAELWDAESDEYLDLLNDASLLLRLELHGQDVGAQRWQALADKCRAHTTDQVLAFIDVHHAISLSAAEKDGAKALLAAMQNYAETNGEDNATVTGYVGLPLARAVVAHRNGDYDKVVETLLPIRYELYRIGGSHAQRDLFAMLLIDACLKCDRVNVARMLISERLGRLPANDWTKAQARAAGLSA